MLYLISDTHFNEFSIIEKFYGLDFFMSADAYMLYSTRRWNDKVTNNDTVIIVGDAGDPACFLNLNGHKILVRGNHDDYPENRYKVFDKVVDYIHLDKFGVKIIIEHILNTTKLEADIRICGHSHNAECYRYNGPTSTQVYVLTNLLGYEPRTLKELFDVQYHNWPYELFKVRERIMTGEYNDCGVKLQ